MNKRPLYLVPDLPPEPECPVCKDEALPEPCPRCELVESFDKNVLTPFQQSIMDAYTKGER